MTDAQEEPKKKSKKGLILALVGLNLVAAGAVGYFVVMSRAQAPDGEEGAEGEEEGEHEEAADTEASETEAKYGPLVEDKPLVGNLNDPGAGRYVKIQLHYELQSEEKRPHMETALVPLRSELLIYFTGVKVEQTIGTENKQRIVDDIKKLADRVAGEGVVRRVFFTEFVTQ